MRRLTDQAEGGLLGNCAESEVCCSTRKQREPEQGFFAEFPFKFLGALVFSMHWFEDSSPVW